MRSIEELAEAFDITWFPHQLEALEGEKHANEVELRCCLYFATGKGKTFTALALLAQAGLDRATVVAPPKTHAKWHYDAALAGIQIRTISHAKYRMKSSKFAKQEPFIIDEFHMLGGSSKEGWKKLRIQSRFMLAPLIILSATPNYNDVERVYCVEYVLDPLEKEDYINWIYRHCDTEQDHFSLMPKVIGFRDQRPAKDHLADLPHVYYIEDPNENFGIQEVHLSTTVPSAFTEFGFDSRSRRIMASIMEAKSVSRKLQLIDKFGVLRKDVFDEIEKIRTQSETPVLVFCARATVARAGHERAMQLGLKSGLVTYDANTARATAPLSAFRDGLLDILFSTATMATGVDGLDKVCDTLILLDDTDDDSLRRQVIGRILPRGSSSNIAKKSVVRFTLAI